MVFFHVLDIQTKLDGINEYESQWNILSKLLGDKKNMFLSLLIEIIFFTFSCVNNFNK